MAERLFREKKYSEAIPIYKGFIRQYPQNNLIPAAYIGLAYCYEETGNLQKAGDMFLNAEKKISGNNNIWAEDAEKGYKRISEKMQKMLDINGGM